MAERERPVWVWLPGQTQPVRCGTFWWSPGLGKFLYSSEYRALPAALPIDPINLPFTRSAKPDTTMLMNGVFGVLRDGAPEGFGLDLLISRYERQTLDEIERMDLAPGDGVGAIEVCPEDLLGHKTGFCPPGEEHLLQALENVEPGASARRVVQQIAGAEDATSLGGEKPKITVARQVGTATEWWIAKLQERGGAPLLPAREYAAMKLAGLCGLDVAEVCYRRAGQHEVVLVKRFDREVVTGGVERSLFASAATVLRLRSDATREDETRSYTAFSDEMRRWCASAGQHYALQQQELWRRMVFNALVGNIDDHPRNHGLLNKDGTWRLSPAYDIVAMPNARGGQAMAVNRKRLEYGGVGERVATPTSLLWDAGLFSYTVEEAWETLQRMARQVHDSWHTFYIACGMDEAGLEGQRPAFRLAEDIVAGVAAPDMKLLTGRTRHGRRRA